MLAAALIPISALSWSTAHSPSALRATCVSRTAVPPQLLISRRAALGGALIASMGASPAFGLAYGTTITELGAKPISSDDPLTVVLQESRVDYGTVPELLKAKAWDKVRQIDEKLLSHLTFSGYTGESVKARAVSWGDAGETELSKAILTRRTGLSRSVGALEQAVFAAQTNKKSSMLSEDELQTAAGKVIAELDGLLPLLGCERRWRSGKCEILPMPEDRSLSDLVAGSKF